MPFPEAKVYKDGSHYIAIPHTTRPKKPRLKRIEEVVTITEEIETETLPLPEETVENIEVEQEPKQVEKVAKKSRETVKINRQMTKKERFDELYQKHIKDKPQARREKIITAMQELFPSVEKTVNFVDANIERKKRNLICKCIRMWRKANLQEFNYFVTFTYDGKLHTEDSFKKSLRRCLWNFSNRNGWKYIGVWERSPEKHRLHFHGVFYIPDGTMPKMIIEKNDYSFKTKRRQKTMQNLYFTERFGRNDFEPLDDYIKNDALAYIMKYIEKTGEKIVYSKGLPQFFISDIMDDDIVCTIGLEDKKLLLFDNFVCWDEGEYIGEVSADVIKRMRKSN